MKIIDKFENISFHDSTIESVTRSDSMIEIIFDFVVVGEEHAKVNGFIEKITQARLRFFGVVSEKSIIWYDSETPLNHPHPEKPITEVMHASFSEGCYHFDGFWQPDDWSEWYISANGFELSNKL